MHESSSCCLIQGDIRYCDREHSYTHIPTNRKLESVSNVIRTVYNKKSWDGVEEAVIENARIRGSRVDQYFADYLRTGYVEIPEGERIDVIERMVIAHRIFEGTYADRKSGRSQVIVYSLEDGIAGTADIVVDDHIVVDLKATYSPEVSWILQIGAYATYLPADEAAIIHASPKFYKKIGGGKLIKYNADYAKQLWASAVKWWHEINEVKVTG